MEIGLMFRPLYYKFIDLQYHKSIEWKYNHYPLPQAIVVQQPLLLRDIFLESSDMEK